MTINDPEYRAQLSLDSAMLVNVSYGKTRPFANINFKSTDILRNSISVVKKDLLTQLNNGSIANNNQSEDYMLFSAMTDFIVGNTFGTLNSTSVSTNKRLQNIFDKHLLNSGILRKGEKYDLDKSNELKFLIIKLIEENNINNHISPSLSAALLEKKQSLLTDIKTHYDLLGKTDKKFEGLSNIFNEMTDTLLKTKRATFPSKLIRKYIDGIPDAKNPGEKIYATVNKEGFVTITNYPTKTVKDISLLDKVTDSKGKIRNRWIDIDNSDKEKSTISFQIVRIDKPSPTIQVVFRGTDLGNDNKPGETSLDIDHYLSQDYFKMKSQYEKMKPFIEDAISYQLLLYKKENPEYLENEEPTFNINYTGHSLGAAYAHIALEDSLAKEDKTISTERLMNNGIPLMNLPQNQHVRGNVTYTANSFNIPPILEENEATENLKSNILGLTKAFKATSNFVTSTAFLSIGISAFTIVASCNPPLLAATAVTALGLYGAKKALGFIYDKINLKPKNDLNENLNNQDINSCGTIFQKKYDIVNLLRKITKSKSTFSKRDYGGSGKWIFGSFADHDMRSMALDVINDFKSGELKNHYNNLLNPTSKVLTAIKSIRKGLNLMNPSASPNLGTTP